MNLDTHKQYGIVAVLALLIAATHGHHFGSLLHLPPATWVVFFAAGFYVRRTWVFAVLLAEVVLIDYFAVTVGGVSSFCISPAYGFLLPAYGTLWMAGNQYAKRYSFDIGTLPMLGASLLGSVALAEILTSGGFYLFSGRFVDTSITEFAARLIMYFPYTLQSFAFWAGVAIIVHAAIAMTHGARKQHI